MENARIYAQISHHSHNSWKNIENPNFFCNRFFISHVLESVDNLISRLETRNAYRRKQRNQAELTRVNGQHWQPDTRNLAQIQTINYFQSPNMKLQSHERNSTAEIG